MSNNWIIHRLSGCSLTDWNVHLGSSMHPCDTKCYSVLTCIGRNASFSCSVVSIINITISAFRIKNFEHISKHAFFFEDLLWTWKHKKKMSNVLNFQKVTWCNVKPNFIGQCCMATGKKTEELRNDFRNYVVHAMQQTGCKGVIILSQLKLTMRSNCLCI